MILAKKHATFLSILPLFSEGYEVRNITILQLTQNEEKQSFPHQLKHNITPSETALTSGPLLD